MQGYDLTKSAAFLGESWMSDSTFLVGGVWTWCLPAWRFFLGWSRAQAGLDARCAFLRRCAAGGRGPTTFFRIARQANTTNSVNPNPKPSTPRQVNTTNSVNPKP